jgi:hypothetical protein
MKLNELSAPERILVTRLAFNEPLPVVNAWLEFNTYKPISPEGLEKMRIKYKDVINEVMSSTDSQGVLKELVDIKDKLVDFSKKIDDPKDLAQVSNALNTVSKTIDDFLERKKESKTDEYLKPDEFLEALLYLQAENYLVFPEGKFEELKSKLVAEDDIN